MVKRKNKINRYEVQRLKHGERCEDAYKNCKKSHESYFSLEELSEKLPVQDVQLLEFIQIMWYLTGWIAIKDKECTYYGTGFVQKIERFSESPCPCPDCDGCGSKEWGKVTLSTAFHVIQKEVDKNNVIIMQKEDGYDFTLRLFYDNPDCTEKIFHGLKSHSYDEDGDWCALVYVIHDLDLLDMLEEKLERHWKLGHSLKEKYQDTEHNLVVVVSHPHGGPKRLSIGKGKLKQAAREVRDEQDWCYYSYDAATCDGSSGGPVYVLGKWNDGYGYWFGHAHNHCGMYDSGDNSSTVGVDSTFRQYTQKDVNTVIGDSTHQDDRNKMILDSRLHNYPHGII